MNNNFLCVANNYSNDGCILKKNKNGLEIVFVTANMYEKISIDIKQMIHNSIRVREEHFSPGQIDIDRVEVNPDDPRYLTGCAEELSQLGWQTFIYPAEQTMIWQKLYELPVPNDLRATFGSQLNTLSKEATQELNEILDRAEKRIPSKY